MLAPLGCGLLGALARGSEPGELDVGFAPPPPYQQAFRFLAVADRQLYVSGGVKPLPFRRLNEDGSLDATWKLRSPVENPVIACVKAPSGGLLVGGMIGSSYWEQSDGSFARITTSLSLAQGTPFAPLGDGSLIVHTGNLQLLRRDAEGREDVGYRQNSRIASVSFVNPGGRSLIGSGAGSTWTAIDSKGRLLVVGNFMSVGDVERLGLARLLPDGRPDPTWNPGPSLGIALTDVADPETLAGFQFPPPTNFITAMPVAVTLGTNDSVLVAIEYVSPKGTQDQRMAVISAEGAVSAVFPDYSMNGTAVRHMQPDGRILVGAGYFTQWNGVPVGNLIRLEPDGTLDTTFQVTFEPPEAQLTAVVLDDNGRLWISGSFTAVNGIERRGLARVHAYDPAPAPPKITVDATRTRIGTNEILYLSGAVTGFPAADLQWYRDGVPVQGETNPGLRLPVTAEADLGEFRLVARNAVGTNEVSFGQVSVALRSPRSGQQVPEFSGPLDGITTISQLVPLPDGRVLFGISGYNSQKSGPLLGRLTAEGAMDRSFGVGGFVEGQGRVEDLQVLPGGSILVAGSFESIAGAPASGLAEFSPVGHRVDRSFPDLDVPSITAALRLPDGRWIIAGRFSRVGTFPIFRLARLKSDLTPDPSFNAAASFQPWQVVETLALDPLGRLLVGGESFAFDGSLTNPAPFGLVRLREDGSADPGFQRVTSPVRAVFVEPGDTLLAGMPLRRWDLDGRLITRYSTEAPLTGRNNMPDHRLVRLPDGRALYPRKSDFPSGDQLARWRVDGMVDHHFETPFSNLTERLRITAAATLPDASVLLAVSDLRGISSIRRLLPDSDARLTSPVLSSGEFRAHLFTQPGRAYRNRSRNALTGLPTTVGVAIRGDGYLSHVTVPAFEDEGYFEVSGEPADPNSGN